MIIADTGFWVGLLDCTDPAHDNCRRFLAGCSEPLITTSPVMTETIHLVSRRAHYRIVLNFLALVDRLREQGSFHLFDLGNPHLARLFELVRQYADLPMDFADASLVLLAETLGHGRILSTDRRDFHAYRWKNHHPFQNLLMEGST